MYDPKRNFPIVTVGENSLTDASYYWLSVSDERYPFSPIDPAQKQAARAAAEERGRTLLRAIEKKLGRELTDKERLRGTLERPDTRTSDERAAHNAKWAAIFAPPAEQQEPNPYLRELAAHEAKKAYEADPKGFDLRVAADQWQKERDAEVHRAELAADPHRRAVVAKAMADLLSLRFDPRAPMAEVAEAEQRLRLAREGDLNLFATEAAAARTRYVEFLREQSKELFAKNEAARAEIAELSQPYTLPTSEEQI